MKKLRILACETHFPDQKQTNAADWWRTIRPLQELQKRTDWDIEIRKGIIDQRLGKNPHSPEAIREWTRIGMNYDLIHYSYNHSAMFYSFVAVVTRKFGHTMTMDYDDNMFRQDLLNPGAVMEQIKDPYELYRVGIILRDIDSLTVTNDNLKQEYKAYLKKFNIKKKITVIPNYIDLEVYKHKEHKKNPDEVVIGFFGSTSHQADLYDRAFLRGISEIRKKYKNVRFELVGNFVPNYLDGLAATRMIGASPDFHTWIKIWQENVCRWDIGLAPNRDTPFNRSRSNIKWQEYAAAKIPMVASDIGLYTTKTPLLAKSRQDWVDHLSRLIENRQYRIDAGQRAYDEVKADWTIQANWEKWRDAILERVPQR